ncbi:MAG: YibE/F family protein [Bacillota bacterium]|nr:YibE/F family protein [Bacillota bacterium]
MNKKILHNILLVTIALSIPLIILLSPLIKKGIVLPDYYNHLFEKAEILEIIEEEIEDDIAITDLKIGRQVLKVKILTGKYKGNIYETVNLIEQSHNVIGKVGLKIIVGIRETDNTQNIWVYNYNRAPYLYIMGTIFIFLLILFGGKQGFNSMIALLFTSTIFIFIMIPLIFKGYHPITLSIISVIITTIVSFLLIGGFEKKMLIAILGTTSGILVAGILSFTFSKLTHLSGINLEKGTQLVYLALDYNIQVRGIMFSSILIASMGAVMDVSMSISSSMYEIYQIDNTISSKTLFTTGMNIGKDIMGTMTNTLILAFMGGSLGLMLVIWGYNMSYNQLINLPFVSIEIIQGLAGSIGIVLTVPFTALMASIILSRK